MSFFKPERRRLVQALALSSLLLGSLAQANTTIQFTNTHIADLRKVIEVDAESGHLVFR